MYFNKVQKCASQCMFSFFSNEKGLCRRVTMNLKMYSRFQLSFFIMLWQIEGDTVVLTSSYGLLPLGSHHDFLVVSSVLFCNWRHWTYEDICRHLAHALHSIVNTTGLCAELGSAKELYKTWIPCSSRALIAILQSTSILIPKEHSLGDVNH